MWTNTFGMNEFTRCIIWPEPQTTIPNGFHEHLVCRPSRAQYRVADCLAVCCTCAMNRHIVRCDLDSNMCVVSRCIRAVSKPTPRGFEPLRAEPNGFRVHLLSHSDTVSMGRTQKSRSMQMQHMHRRPKLRGDTMSHEMHRINAANTSSWAAIAAADLQANGSCHVLAIIIMMSLQFASSSERRIVGQCRACSLMEPTPTIHEIEHMLCI